MNPTIASKFRDAIAKHFDRWTTTFTMEQIGNALLHNSIIYQDVKDIKVSGGVFNRRVSATLDVLDTNTSRTFPARFRLTFNGESYRFLITEVKGENSNASHVSK